MGGRYPKPDDERVGRAPRQFGWTDLPVEGREGKPPVLPKRAAGAGAWYSQTRTAWKNLWASPQATQWDQSGVSLHRWAMAHDESIRAQVAGGRGVAGLLAEMRQIEDRHGLSPKSMLQLRWRIAEVDEPRAAIVPVTDDRKVVMLKRRKGA